MWHGLPIMPPLRITRQTPSLFFISGRTPATERRAAQKKRGCREIATRRLGHGRGASRLAEVVADCVQIFELHGSIKWQSVSDGVSARGAEVIPHVVQIDEIHVAVAIGVA